MKNIYRRKVTAWERMMNISPYSVVSMIVRIKGEVTESMLREAVNKIQQRHSLLQVRIEVDENQTPWFTSEGVGEIPIEIKSRKDKDTWIEVYDLACKQPFEFDKYPLVRFYLLQSDNITDVMIFCHHVICDGISLAFLARDLMEHLGDTSKEVELLTDIVPISRKTIPEKQQLNKLVEKVFDKINTKWEQEEIVFDHEDYLNLHKKYWETFTHKTVSLELTEEETKVIIDNSKANKVTVNSALTAAFMGAQKIVQGDKPYDSKGAVAVDLRNSLNPPVGDGMGFYASIIDFEFKYNLKKDMWENAKVFHKKVTKLYNEKNYFKYVLNFNKLSPSFLESKPYKILGHLITSEQSRYEKISSFSKREDTLLAVLKRNNSHSIENVSMGTAVTNLTRMNFPTMYGKLELDRLIVHPGAGFPLVTVNIVVGIVTCSNKMSILLDFAEEQINTITVKEIAQIALQSLLGEYLNK